MAKVLVVENSVDRYRATSSILNVIYGCKIANRDRGINGSVLNVDNMDEYVDALLNGVIKCDIIFIRSKIVGDPPDNDSGGELARRLQHLRARGVALVLMSYNHVENDDLFDHCFSETDKARVEKHNEYWESIGRFIKEHDMRIKGEKQLNTEVSF